MYLQFVACVIFALISKTVLSNIGTCPTPENIAPCICTGSENNIRVHCSGLQSLTILEIAIQSLSKHKFSTFYIADSNLEYIPADLFKNTTIQHISIFKSNFSRIGRLGDDQFEGLENSLESLKFEETFSESSPLAYVFLQNLKKLHSFEFRNSYAGIVHNQWFKDGPESLIEIYFVNAKILNMGYKALQSLKNLKIVDLSDNEINFVTRTMLPNPALQLSEINLERNKLASFPENMFEGMPNLKRVVLELNELSTIDETVWGRVWSGLKHLNVDFNPMICDKNIKWIYENKRDLEEQLVGTCYKPFTLMDRDLHSLTIDEVK